MYCKLSCNTFGICNALLFRTTLDFDGEYLRNGLRYRQAEDGISTAILLCSTQKDLVNFGTLIAKFSCLISTYPKWTVRAILGNFGRISLDRIEISTKRKTTLSTTMSPAFEEIDLVNFGPLTNLFRTCPRSPLRVLCRLMQLHCQVAFLGAKFQPINFLSRTYGPGRPHVGLCPKFLVYLCTNDYFCILLVLVAAFIL